jgi:starch phosphorylase
VAVTIEGREVALRAWRYDVVGESGYTVPVFFLDADIDENDEHARRLTDYLYGGDHHYRLCQEVILGIGGVRMLRAFGIYGLERFHMNEGHAALLGLELLREQAGGRPLSPAMIAAIRAQCVFTTHTPVAAGHDKFDLDLVEQVLGEQPYLHHYPERCCEEKRLNMTLLALSLSHYVNGVAKKHGEVSRAMFPGVAVDYITNGIHCVTWAAEPMAALYDRFIEDWRADNSSLRQVLKIDPHLIKEAHTKSKKALCAYIREKTHHEMHPEVFTVGFARRAAQYKRADLIFHDVQRLHALAEQHGALQLVFSGKAHPADEGGKALIHRVIQEGSKLSGKVSFAYLEGYNMELGKLLTAGVDIWLNNPEPPLEASGTSGMKACLNGVPNLSVLDGWWIEGHIEHVTGWSIETSKAGRDQRASDAAHLYAKLGTVMDLFYNRPQQFQEVMRHTIALNAPFFNTQRMVRQYVLRAYFRGGVALAV